MRGSGCSGGVFDLFDLPTTADGYDIIETVAAQPWVQDGKVGMVGISFPGISQLFVGGAQPPHLAAHRAALGHRRHLPLARLPRRHLQQRLRGDLAPGARRRRRSPRPRAARPWAIKRVNKGDTTCLANQQLRLQTQDPVEFTETHPFYTPSLMDDRSPINWVDEHPGADLPRRRLAGRADRRRLRLDAVERSRSGPTSRSRCRTACTRARSIPTCSANWIAFLDLYVAQQRAGSGPRRADRADHLPADPRHRARRRRRCRRTASTASPDYGQALDALRIRSARARADGERRRLVDSRAPGADVRARLRASGRRARCRPTAWYFGPDGTLTPGKPRGERRRRQLSPRSRRASRGRPCRARPVESWAVLPPYDWRPLVDGNGGGLRHRAARRRPDHRRVRAASISGCARAPPTRTSR